MISGPSIPAANPSLVAGLSGGEVHRKIWLKTASGRFLTCLVWLGLVRSVLAADPANFESANKLYFEGRFAEAAATYEQLVQTGQHSAVLCFNLGNAYFKAGQNGRAIAAYRRAQHFTPRDPALRFNLKFVRQKVTGSEAPVDSAWQRWLAVLTLNEWTLLCAGAFWLWFLLLSLTEARTSWRKNLRQLTVLAGAATVFFAGCLLALARQQGRQTSAVLIVPEAVVRQGPLERAQAAFQLRDGSEVNVLEKQEITEQGKPQTWLYIQDRARRAGWLKGDQVIVLKF